jgi:hypothetical protein
MGMTQDNRGDADNRPHSRSRERVGNFYDPSRKTLGALGEWTRENLNVAAQYGEWLSRGDVPSAQEIAPGQGAIIRESGLPVACHRDLDGRRIATPLSVRAWAV